MHFGKFLSCVHVKGKSLNDFKFGTAIGVFFVWVFLSDGVASVAAEWLN